VIRAAFLFALLLVLALPAHSAHALRPKGANCNLIAPPADAGEEMIHGLIIRVFPRARDINATYSGCQAVLVPDGKKWTVLFLTEIVAGDPVRIWSPDKSAQADLACRYKQGKVIKGDPDECLAPELLLRKSLAPGCSVKIQEAVAKHGLGAPRPPECEYQ